MEINTSQKKRAFSLIEMLIYVSLLAIIFLVVINTVLSFSTNYVQIIALRAADHGAIDAMERMTREIRDAASVDVAHSSLDTSSGSSGSLTLIKTGTTTKFYVSPNGYLQMDINGAYVGPLTGSSTSITSLTFRLLSTTTSTAVRIDMTIQGTSGTVTKTKQVHSTVVLRGS